VVLVQWWHVVVWTICARYIISLYLLIAPLPNPLHACVRGLLQVYRLPTPGKEAGAAQKTYAELAQHEGCMLLI
jgi:hypothetical protein